MLDHLHILCNYEWDSRALLSLLLVGLPELRERLSQKAPALALLPHPPPAADRLHQPRGTADYLRHRLRIASCDRDIFPDDAIAILHEAAQGLRYLDRLAQAAMRDAVRRKKKLVERDAVLRVAESHR